MVKIFDRSLNILKQNKARRERGLLNSIPVGMNRFEEYFPGIEKKCYYIVTASSGVGKSKFTKYLFVLQVFKFIKENPSSGIKVKMFYFCLEESRENFIHSLMCAKLAMDYGIRISIKQLKSIGKTRVGGELVDAILSDEILEKIEQMKDYFYDLENSIEIIDNIKNPYGIYKKAMDYAEANGHWVMKKQIINDEEVEVRDYYVPNNPEEYVLTAVDHISLIQPEKGMSLHEAISKLSSKYFIDLRDKYSHTVINVQQQSADKEKQQFTYKGQSIESKLEPSLDGLGDNKMTQRDADIVFGIFAPDRYEIKEHRDYKVDMLQDNYRSVLLLKSRDGSPNIRLGMFFDGATNAFNELPRAKEMRDDDYMYYLSKVGRGEDFYPCDHVNFE